jgi:hypothetical protein
VTARGSSPAADQPRAKCQPHNQSYDDENGQGHDFHTVVVGGLIGFTGLLTIHSSTSDASQQALPPSARLRGNFPLRIHAHIVGNEAPTTSHTSIFDISRIWPAGLASDFVDFDFLTMRVTPFSLGSARS